MADRRLHIGIDGRELVGTPTGVGRYLSSVLREWVADAGFPHQVTVFVPRDPSPLQRIRDPRLTWRVLPSRSAGTWWEQTTLARAARSSRLDVFFGAGYTAPIRLSLPSVVAVYDVSFFAHPEWFGAREGVRRRWLTRAAARRATSIITISQFSAAEIVKWLGVPRERVRLAPPGAPVVTPGPRAGDRAPLVLFVGSLFTRRHIPELIEAFATVVQRVSGARLVLVGENRTRPAIDPRALARQAGIEAAVEWREYVSDEDLARLYGQARVFVFLSDYEGFAMTPLEGMAHGVPPVLLDTPIAREVYGDAARIVRLTTDGVAAALVDLLQNDASHAALVAAGRGCLARYSWADSARVVRRALGDAAGER
ncbi:MAG: glycosyltransferase family 4 protein [Vicinamibacterales bacterium]